MKKFLAALVIGLSLVTFTLDASAARLGGRASFGRSMTLPKAAPSAPLRSPSASTRAPRNAAAANTATKSGGFARNLLLGAAGALGFMALAHMLGLGEGFAQMLMILVLLGLAMLAFRMFMARKQEPASAQNRARVDSVTPTQKQAQEDLSERFNPSTAYAPRPGSALDEFSEDKAEGSSFEVPKEFDKEAFLNMSTSYFKMLQKAWDSGDMDSLNNYCTQDMFVELTHKRREIKGANVTEIIQLSADLAGFETTPSEYVASVSFKGVLKENGETVDFEEIWNLVKPIDGKEGWLLAGIQQVA